MSNKKPLVNVMPFKPVKGTLNEAVTEQTDPVRVSGVLQRAEAKNQNGRIYPKEILKRETEKYRKDRVNQRRALGELDHPDCVRGSAKILTSRGWISVKEIRDDEKVYTLNPNTQEVELQKITKKVDQPYSGKMIKIKGRNIDTLVTPNHRFYLINRYGKGYFATAQDIHDNPKAHSKSYIPKTALNEWSGTETGLNGHMKLKGVSEDHLSKYSSKKLRKKYSKDVEIPSDTWMKFLGIFLADGSSSGGGYSVKLTQKKEEGKRKIRELISRFPKEFNWKEVDKGKGKVDFVCHDARLHSTLAELGDTYSKYVPSYALESRSELLQDMYEWYRMGDGRDVDHNGYNRKEVFSVSEKLIDGFHEVLLKIGKSGSRTKQISNKDYNFAGHTIKTENKKPLHVLHESTTKGIYLDPRFIEVEEVHDYDDNVYCVSVPNETIYLMDQGKAFWSGNSSVVNLKNVSHNVVSMEWQGNDLVGEIEILSTPAGNILKELFKSNVNVGISSRGMGSVKESADGTLIVDDDFELIAFDFVSNPSTHGAFMEQGQINESFDPHSGHDGKWDRVDNLVSELVKEMSGEYRDEQ